MPETYTSSDIGASSKCAAYDRAFFKYAWRTGRNRVRGMNRAWTSSLQFYSLSSVSSLFLILRNLVLHIRIAVRMLLLLLVAEGMARWRPRCAQRSGNGRIFIIITGSSVYGNPGSILRYELVTSSDTLSTTGAYKARLSCCSMINHCTRTGL